MLSDGTIIGEREHRTYLEHVYFEAELDVQRRMVQHRVPVALLSDVTEGKLERAPRFREITGPLGMGYELFTVCAVGREQWGEICLIRERGRPDFDVREVALLRGLAPHVGTGLQAAALRARAATMPEADNAPGVLVLDDRGRVVQHTAAAERWLREIDDLGPDWLEGGSLPVPVWMVIGALRNALAPGTDRELHGIPFVHAQTRAGRWLTFHGAITESHAGRGGETVVIVEPASSRELGWPRVSAYGLSERERAVVDLVVQGASTKEISRALVQRLFFDHLYPALSAPAEAAPRM